MQNMEHNSTLNDPKVQTVLKTAYRNARGERLRMGAYLVLDKLLGRTSTIKSYVNRTKNSSLTALYNILRNHSGSCPAFVHLQDTDKTDTVIALPETLTLKACGSLTREVNGFLGYNAVETVCSDAVY